MPASNVDVVLRLRGARNFQRQVAQSGAQLQAMGVKGAAAMSSFAQKSQALKSAGSSLTRNVGMPAVLIGAIAGKTALDFDKSMNQVQVALGAPKKAMAELREQAMQMGQDTIFSANDAAQAILDLGKGGMTTAQIQGGALETTMNLAAAGGIELADAAKQSSSAINTFGLEAKDSMQVADALAGAANESSADLADLSIAFRMAGQGAVNAGLNINETSGALAAFADQGLIGSDAGTSLKTMLQRLNPQSVKAKEAINELGLEFFKSNGQFKSLRGITGELEQGFKGLTDEQKAERMQTIFGSDATRAASILLREGKDGVSKYIKATKEKGAAEKMARAQMKGLAGVWENLKGSMETAALVLGRRLKPTLMAIGDALKFVFDWFTKLPKPVQQFAAALLLASIAIGPLVKGIGYVAHGMGMMLNVLPNIIKFFQLWISGMAAGQGVLGGLRIALASFGISLKAVMITTGIGAVVVALVVLEEKFGLVTKAVEWLKGAAVVVFNWIKEHWRILAIIITGPFGAAIIWIADHFGRIKEIASNVFNAVKNAVRDAFQWIKNAAADVVGFFRSNWKTILAILTGPFGLAVKFILDRWGAITGFFRSIPGRIRAGLSVVGSVIRGIFGPPFNFVKGLVQDFLNLLGDVMDKIEDLAGPLADVAGTIGDVGGKIGDVAGGIIPGQHGLTMPHTGLALVGEAGPEILKLPGSAQVIPLDHGGGGGAGGSVHHTTVIQLDGKTVARNTVAHLERARARA